MSSEYIPSAMTFPLWYFSSYVAIMCFVVMSSPLLDDGNCDDGDNDADVVEVIGDTNEGLLLLSSN